MRDQQIRGRDFGIQFGHIEEFFRQGFRAFDEIALTILEQGNHWIVLFQNPVLHAVGIFDLCDHGFDIFDHHAFGCIQAGIGKNRFIRVDVQNV